MGETWKLLPFRLLREMSELKTKNVRLFLQFLHVFSHGEEDIRTYIKICWYLSIGQGH